MTAIRPGLPVVSDGIYLQYLGVGTYSLVVQSRDILVGILGGSLCDLSNLSTRHRVPLCIHFEVIQSHCPGVVHTLGQ